MFEVYTIKYGGKIHRYTTSKSDGLVDLFVANHGYSRKEAEREINDMNIREIESMLISNGKISQFPNRPSTKLVLSKGKNGVIARLSISKTAKNNV